LENLGLSCSFRDAYKGRRILVTGHTGFKGSWLACWLHLLGAEVKGYALAPAKPLNHFDLLNLAIDSELGDIRNRDQLLRAVRTFKPEFIFHLAAQALVKPSYESPEETFSTNVMGLVNVLDAALATDSVVGVINVTSDKCYENRNSAAGYRENDRLGGHDPYSASKACAELITTSYRKSFYAGSGKLLASARAGNVVGGGDWSDHRLVPDVVRAIQGQQKVHVRRPQATRPWQHVLEPLRGYLMLGERMLAGAAGFDQAWNFGATRTQGCSVRDVLAAMVASWPAFELEFTPKEATFHEADLLQLDSSKARQLLDWQPLLEIPATFAMTMDWYRHYLGSNEVITLQQIASYSALSAPVGDLQQC